jgi:hypothetical protein
MVLMSVMVLLVIECFGCVDEDVAQSRFLLWNLIPGKGAT